MMQRIREWLCRRFGHKYRLSKVGFFIHPDVKVESVEYCPRCRTMRVVAEYTKPIDFIEFTLNLK